MVRLLGAFECEPSAVPRGPSLLGSALSKEEYLLTIASLSRGQALVNDTQ